MLHYISLKSLSTIIPKVRKGVPDWVLELPNTRDLDSNNRVGRILMIAVEDLKDAGWLNDVDVPQRYVNPFTSRVNPDGKADTCFNGCHVSRKGLLVRNTTFVVQDGVVSTPEVCLRCFKEHLLSLRCHFCGGLPGHDGRNPTIEHLTPKSRGGPDHPDNLAPACNTCNNRKGTKTESEFMTWLHEANTARAALRKLIDGDDGNFRQLTFWDL